MHEIVLYEHFLFYITFADIENCLFIHSFIMPSPPESGPWRRRHYV